MSIREIANHDYTAPTVGVTGTLATWSLDGTLSRIAAICTIIVVAPKAWEQAVKWYLAIAALLRRNK